MKREDYLSVIQRYQNFLDRSFWDEGEGIYREAKVVGNSQMLPPLTLLAIQGDANSRSKIPRIIERMVHAPPWDATYHYWNGEWDILGQEPHGGGTLIGSYLAMPLMHARELGLGRELADAALDRVTKMIARWARFTDHAREADRTTYTDEAGKPVDVGALLRDSVRRGVPVNLGYLREAGPKNQVSTEMRAAALMFLATGREEHWDSVLRFWNRIIDKVEGGRPHLFPACFDPDYSYIYSVHPAHRYEMSVYTAFHLGLYADVVRIARKVGRPNPVWEEFIRNWAHAVLTRVVLNDGLCNLVLNGYGWERVFLNAVARSYALHPLIPLADLTPLSKEELSWLTDSSIPLYRAWKAETNDFPPHLGLKGQSASTPFTNVSILTSELALRLLTNEESFGVEPRVPEGCLSSFSWHQKYFVFQSPSYQVTVVGSGAELRPDEGHLGFGVLSSGGEYVIKAPGGDYLTPISEQARTVLEARVNGEVFSSTGITLANRDAHGLEMKVILPDGRELSRGEPFGPLLYDPRLDHVGLGVRYTKGPAVMGRRFEFNPDAMRITDFIEATEAMQVDYAFTQLPIITVTARGDIPRIRGISAGKRIQIRPPVYMGYEVVHDDQLFIQSISDLEYLEVRYPGCALEMRRLDRGNIRLRITRGEWQENTRMRVDGKNLDYLWISEPVTLASGQRRSFQYEIRVLKAGG